MTTLPEIEELYGPEFVRDVKQIVRGETAGLESEVKNNALQGRRRHVMAVLDGDPVIGAIWRPTNSEPGFLAWLAEIDPLFGVARMSALQPAFDQGDAARVRALFAAYLVEQKRIPASAASGAAPGRPWMAPPPSSGRVPAGEQRQRRWTRAQVAQFYEECRLGRFSKREDERARIEREIIAAGKEGRIEAPFDPNLIASPAPSQQPSRRRFRYRATA